MDRSVTVSVVSHGQAPILADLLADLRRLDPPWLARLIVTLNIDEPAPLLDGWPADRVEVIRNRSPKGFGANHNQAFSRCGTEWFAVLNPDLRFPEDSVAAMLRAAHAGDGLVAPLVLEGDGRPADSARRLLTPFELLRRRFGADRGHPWAGPPDWIAGMCLLLRSAAFRAVGGFDERYFMYCEDADLSLRLQLAGWRLHYSTEASVRHAAQRATYRSLRHFRWHVTSVLKHWASPAFRNYLRLRRSHGLPGPTLDARTRRSPEA